MLSQEENELITRVGPGTPMGNLYRRFWLPALLPTEVPHADSDPIRFRILGEDLIAFRDSNAKVGFIANNCPHRGASLFFGRNEESGLRCVWRVTTFVLPMFISIPGGQYSGSGHFTLPMDDEHSWWFVVEPPPPLGSEWVLKPGQLTPGDADPAVDPTNAFIPGTWRRVRNKDNDYLIDRQRQRTYNYSGLPGNRVEDAAMTESMGPIYDRTREHLGTTDVAIIFWRRMMLRMARNLEQGIEPSILNDPDRFRAVPLQTTSSQGDFGALWADHHGGYRDSRLLSR